MARDRKRPYTPVVTAYTPPKFDYDDPAMLEYLDKEGYAVVKAVANQEQVLKAHDDFWEVRPPLRPRPHPDLLARDLTHSGHLCSSVP